MWFHTLAASGAERVNAIHENFAGRTNADVLRLLYWGAPAVIVLFFVLALANHLQQRRERQQQVAHRAGMNAKRHRTARARVTRRRVT